MRVKESQSKSRAFIWLAIFFFHQVSESQPMPEIELPDDGTEYLDITGQYIPYDTSNVESLESVQVNVSAEDCIHFACL